MNELVVKEYLGSGITFKNIEGEIYANATEMAKCFPNKNLSTWINSKGTEEYIEAMCIENKQTKDFYLDVKQGGVGHGTWIHETLCLDLARWLNTSFRIWCDKQIATLIREGSVSIEPQFKAPTTLKEALLLALEQQEKIEQLEIENDKKNVQLIEQAPKVEFADKLLKSKANILIGDFAKVMCDEGYNIGEGRLFEWLRTNKYIYKEHSFNKPYQSFVDRGYFVTKTTPIKSAYRDFISITTLITPIGQVYLYNKLKDEVKFNKKK